MVKAHEISTRASMGALFFDGERPDWFTVENFNLDNLDVADMRNCPLALFGQDRFMRVADRLGLSRNERVRYGFFILLPEEPDEEEDDPNAQYAALTEAWRAEVLLRRALYGEHNEQEEADGS